jgi:hypothetical protein
MEIKPFGTLGRLHSSAGMLMVKAGYPPEGELDQADLAAANWAWSNDRPAGRGSDTPKQDRFDVYITSATKRTGFGPSPTHELDRG